MAIIKVGFKAGGTSIKQTYTGAFIRVVTTSGGTTTVTKYPIYNVSGTVVYSVITTDKNATDFEILNSVLLPVLGDRYTDQKGNVYNGVFYAFYLFGSFFHKVSAVSAVNFDLVRFFHF